MELFIKRFIDLLDEVAPVSMVHTLIEQPLGSVSHDSYVKIHSRLDLVNEESPFVEIELYPYDDQHIEALFAYTYPSEGIRLGEEEFVNRLNVEYIQAEKVTPIDQDDETTYYEVFYEEDINIPLNNGGIDEVIHQLVPKIKEWLMIGGYELEEED